MEREKEVVGSEETKDYVERLFLEDVGESVYKVESEFVVVVEEDGDG